MNTILLLLIFAIPIAIFIGFFVSLANYKNSPPEEKKKWKTALIITGILGLFLLIIIVGIFILLAVAIRNM